MQAIVLVSMAVFLMSSAAVPTGLHYVSGTVAGVTEDSVATDSAGHDTVIAEPNLLWPIDVQSRLDVLLRSDMLRTSTVGLMVYDLTADSVIFKYNEKQLMRPASTLKMMVAVAALDRLGDGYEYETGLYMTGEVTDSVLDGDLYCKGGFDPVFGQRDLSAFVDSVRSLGVDTIRGNLYADLSMKDADRLGEGWCWDDDNPVLTPLLINGKDGFVEEFKSRLHRAGITVEGEVKEARTPSDAIRKCTVKRAVKDILPRMMKKSDNLYSESLFYHLAASRVHSATVNYVSPELEVAFLKYAYRHDRIYVPLYASMPIAGMDGTLDDRMRRGYARGNVHAKTGTVTGVSGLAGYCTAANGHVLCFSIINMGIRHASSGRRFQDSVCEALCRP